MNSSKLKVDYISDIHLDFWIKNMSITPKFHKRIDNFIKNILKPLDGDVLVTAGDLGHYFSQDTALLLALKKHYERIVVVRGNHDMYLVSNNQMAKYKHNSFKRVQEMKDWCKENDIDYLDGDVIEINNIKIGGVGMWYNLPTNGHIEQWNQVMNDSNLIMKDWRPYYNSFGYGGKIKVGSFDTQRYYLDELEKLKNIECNILVTHVPPVLIPEEYKGLYAGDNNNIFYESDNIEAVNNTGCEFVISGHVHEEYELNYDNFELLINPLGYKSEQRKDLETGIKQIIFDN